MDGWDIAMQVGFSVLVTYLGILNLDMIFDGMGKEFNMMSVWKRLDALEATAAHLEGVSRHVVQEWQLPARDAHVMRLEETVRLLMAHLRLEVQDVPASPPRREVVKAAKQRRVL